MIGVSPSSRDSPPAISLAEVTRLKRLRRHSSIGPATRNATDRAQGDPLADAVATESVANTPPFIAANHMFRTYRQSCRRRFADRVTVPDVVGLPFHVGRDTAFAAGVTLANTDPDGPPIGALAWPGLFYITSQTPAADAVVYRWDSVAVEIVAYGEADSNAVAVRPVAPPSDIAHAEPERDTFIDLTEPDDSTD